MKQPFYLTPAKGAKVSDIGPDRIDWFVAEASAKRKFSFEASPTPKNVLVELGLSEKNRILNAALMLFGKKPQRFCPAAVVKCSHYHGIEVARPIPSQQVFAGTLFEQCDDAADFVLSRLDRTIGGREDATAADEKLEIPKEAIREIIVNAVVHRDYDSNASVQIDVFADRVEFMNPGGLPDELTVDDLVKEHLSVPVNPFLARPFYLAGYINQLGYGTRNVVKWCRKAGLPNPKFDPAPNRFRVTIWRNWLTEDRLNQLNLNERQRSAIAFLKERGRISNPEYQKAAKAIKKTATRDLRDLVDKGILEQRGTRGPGVHYVLATNRDKMETIGTSAAEVPNGDKTGTKGTSARPGTKPTRRKTKAAQSKATRTPRFEKPGSGFAQELLELILEHPNEEEQGLTEILRDCPSGPLYRSFIPNTTAAGSAPSVKKSVLRTAIAELTRLGWLLPPEGNDAVRIYELNPDTRKGGKA